MTTLHQYLCNTVEGGDTKVLTVSVFGVVSSKIRGITIANAKYTSTASQTDIQTMAGIGHNTSFSVLDFNGNDGHIPTISHNRLTISLQYNLRSGFGGFNGLRHDALAILIAYSHHLAWLIGGLKLKVAVARHLLATKLLTVHGEFYFIAVAIGPQLYLFTFMSLQIPMGEDVQSRLLCPP